MELRLLGPVELWTAGREVSLGRPRQRCVLAALALTPGRPVEVDQLVVRVWDDQPPAGARSLLYTHVSRLRRALEQAGAGRGRDVLRRAGGGYLLDVDPDRVDLHLARRLAAEATASRGRDTDGDRRAAELLAEAAGLWRGVPLAGLGGAWVDRTREAVGQERLAMLTDWFAVRLRLGQHGAVIGPLSDLLAEHPTVEPLAGLLMIALYRAGRQAEALQVYGQLRRRLVDEIGDEPGGELRQLHEQILRRDQGLQASPVPPPVRSVQPAGQPTVGAAGRTPAGGTGHQVVPAQLPADVAGFTGRVADLRRLDALLAATGAGQPTAVLISAIDGAAGVGKTALAVHWAHLVRDRFPDGQLYANLRGYAPGSPLQPLDVLSRFLRAVGVPAEKVPMDHGEAADLYRSLLADRRMLVLLDNAASPEQVRPLLPGGDGSLVVVTSRDQLGGLVAMDGAGRLSLGVLAAADAAELLSRLLGAERAEEEPDALAALAALCGHLPLALRIAGANLAARPGYLIADYVRLLRTGDRLAELAVPGDHDSAVSAAFDLSYARLPEAVRRMFRLLALVPGADLTMETAARLAGVSTAEAGRTLATLAGAHLVEEHVAGRYTCHDLLREYAASRVEREDTEAQREAALDRLYGFYLAACDAAADIAYPQVVRLAPDTGSPPAEVRFADPDTALAWLDAERANLVAAVQHAAGRGRYQLAWILANNLRGFFWLRMHTADWATVAYAGLAAAEAAGDTLGQAAGYLGLASLCWRQERFRQAVTNGTTALTLARRVNWIEGQAAALATVGTAYGQVGDAAAAIGHFTQALQLFDQLGMRPAQAAVLSNLGSTYLDAGQMRLAAEHLRRGLAMNVELGIRNAEAINLGKLGVVYYFAGRLDRALDKLCRAQAIHQAIGSSVGTGDTQRWLAEVKRIAGRYRDAMKLATASRASARDRGLWQLEAEALITLGAVHRDRGEHDIAIDHYQQALELGGEEKAGRSHSAVDALIGLADTYIDLGDRETAGRYLDRALRTAREVGFRLHEANALTGLARLHQTGADPEQAVGWGRQAMAVHRETGYRLGQANTHVVLGHAYQCLGDTAVADGHWRQAHALFTDIGSPEADRMAALLPG